ncbi:hypothetical protein BHE90_010404 [Fusarium euwallaceae]|uniref:Clr5 domain-containing protein n=1 Tax=Fusarium euwallaceae TaxID=1147111 RepID=A0A430LHE1_9HYPO|nr:hypothetical protein BHE90_010404 [Fusarium euwallaceae]
MAIDWKPYEREVNRWYLDEGKTANEVIQLLLRKYNLEVTSRQFKTKFGGCKKISSKEWSILIPKIREREANGLKSVVYVCGKAVKQQSVARSIRRYSKLCRDGSQSEATVGIDTIDRHRIEIRAPSESGDPSTAEVQPPRQEGVNPSSSQSDELDVDEEFGLAEMDVEPGDPASVGNAICPSPSMFLGSLDQLPPNLLETLPFSDTHGMQMESDGTVLSSSQWLPLSPSIDLTTLFPFQHTFKSFWDSLDISVLTLKGCEAAVDVAKRIGIFVPDYSRHKFLPKLGISPAQTGVPSPILQSIEEVLTHPESKIPGAPRTGQNQAQLNFSPTLLDVVQGDSLAQALSVIVYMVSNNLLDAEESLRLICWILKRGHVPNLLTFSRLPAVKHLAFGPEFLGAIAKTADRLLPSNAEAISLIGDFVSSREFLSLVKSYHEHISGPLGTMLFRLAIQTDSMELAKLLGSHGVDLRSDSVCPRDSDHTPVLALAINWGRHSILDLIISVGVDVNQSFLGRSALKLAILIPDDVATQTLLDAGALIPDQILFTSLSQTSPKIRALLRERLGREPRDSRFVCWELLIAARKGNRELSKVSIPDDMAPPQVLEQAICRAIGSDDLPATRTFLQRRTDPNVGMATFRDHLSKVGSSRAPCQSEANTLYLLSKAGAQVDSETALLVQRFLDLQDSQDFDVSPLLRVLLGSGYDEAWVHEYLLTSYAKQGSIFECDACIDSGTPINGCGIRGQSALSLAARRGHLALVQHLISRGAAPNLPPRSDHPNWESALYAALARGHWEVASYLIDSGGDVTTRATTRGATFLEGVVFKPSPFHKNIEDVNENFQNILALSAPVNRLNSTDSMLLHGLLDWGQLDCLELALQAGARTEDKYEGLTPMQLAVLKKDSEAIRFLLQHGANINGCPRPVGNDTVVSEIPSPSPIRPHNIDQFREPMKHTLFSHVDSSGFLIGISAHKEPYFPHTPLQLASSSEDPDFGIVELLLSQGADINAPAAKWHGRTALQGAASAKKLNMEVVELLLSEGADVNAPPAHVGGVTALQGAAIRGDIQLVRLLLDRRASINAPGSPKGGRTALEGAAEHGRMEMLRFLLSKGAIPDFVTGYSRAIELAEKELHLGVAKFLREEQRKLHEMGWGLEPLGLDLDPL